MTGATTPNMWEDTLKAGRAFVIAELKRQGYEPNEEFLSFADVKGSAQWRLRQKNESPKSMDECLLAVVEALVLQGGVPAWVGDGTSCVAQIIWNQHERAEYFAQRVDELQKFAEDLVALAALNRRDNLSIVYAGIASIIEETCQFGRPKNADTV